MFSQPVPAGCRICQHIGVYRQQGIYRPCEDTCGMTYFRKVHQNICCNIEVAERESCHCQYEAFEAHRIRVGRE